jgi:tetrahydromethanopterin S-methyltransferase subunit B
LKGRHVAIAEDAFATAPGRSRFLAMCGVLSASAFAIAIAFDIPSTLALRLCWSIPQ